MENIIALILGLLDNGKGKTLIDTLEKSPKIITGICVIVFLLKIDAILRAIAELI